MTVAEPDYYSRDGEDYLLNWLFEGIQSGFYVDIGASDGKHISNTYFFEQLGWSGVCVEPHHDYLPLLRRNRPRAVCIQAAIVDAPQPFVAFKKDGFETVDVPALTPDVLMETHAAAHRRFEILSIDTGGTELEVLRAFDLNRFAPAAIVIEANENTERHEILSLLSSRGYHFARRLGGSLIFCRFSDLAIFARHKRIRCRRADALHPLGEAATPQALRGGVIEQRGPYVAPNVLCQETGQPFSTLLEWFPDDAERSAPTSPRIVHAVNLSSARIAEQEATTRSLLQAVTRTSGDVTLLNVQHRADPELTPDGFVRGRDLTRDITDVKEFEFPRSLPLIFDVLDSAVEGARADDYVVFTNTDICVREYFYTCIQELIGFGFDAITVNRRTIGRVDAFPVHSQLPLAETGLEHPGFDCFVFRRGIYDRFTKNLACVGLGGMARGLMYNMVAHSTRMLMLGDVSLTYHYGNDRPWTAEGWSDYWRHNAGEYLAVLESLCRESLARERLTAFCENHREPQRARRYVRELDSGHGGTGRVEARAQSAPPEPSGRA